MKIINSTNLWQAIIDLQGHEFSTSGRGSRPGIQFSYHVKPEGTAAGKHYDGESVPGWSNELIVDRKEKSVTRASAELAYQRVLEMAAEQGVDVPIVSGPKKLNVFGASYLYPIFLEMGVIRKESL